MKKIQLVEQESLQTKNALAEQAAKINELQTEVSLGIQLLECTYTRDTSWKTIGLFCRIFRDTSRLLRSE
jgi:hypothetical protein